MFLSKHKLFIPRGDKLRTKSIVTANALAIELLNYGLLLDVEIIDRLTNHKPAQAREYANTILKAFTAGNLTSPLFPEWENRTEFTLDERIFQIVGYILNLSGSDLENPQFMESLRDNVEFKKFKNVDLATFEEAENHFNVLVSSSVGQNRKQLKTALEFANVFSSGGFIRSDEARIAVLLAKGYEFMTELKCRPSDPMRYFAAKTDITSVNLPHDVIYSNVKWSERVSTMRFWSSMKSDTLMEAMSYNRGAWVRFFRHIHMFKQSDFVKRFPSVVAAGWVSSGNKLDATPKGLVGIVDKWIKEGLVETTDEGALVYRSEASRIQAALDSGKWKQIRKALDGKSGYLLRNLMTVSNAIKPSRHKDLRTWVSESISDANINVLFSLLQINVKSKFRIIDVKGDTIIQPANYPAIIGDIQIDIQNEIKNRHSVNGKIRVSRPLRQQAVPFLSRNQELDRGSKISFKNECYLYFFMHWVQSGNRSTDLDHSFLIFNSKMGLIDTISYRNQANTFIASSGDFTSAHGPDGSTEYGRIDLTKVPKDARYIVPVCNVYSGDVFSKNTEAYAGFQFSSNTKFKLQRDHVRYDLNQPAQANMPFMIDLKNRDITILDINQRERRSANVDGYVDDVKKMMSAIKTRNTMTIERFADILSGDGDENVLSIKTNPSKEGEIAPSDMSKLIS